MYEIKMYEIKTIRSADEIESGNVAEIAVYNWGGEYRPVSRAILAFIPDEGFLLKIWSEEQRPRATFTGKNEGVCRDSCLEFFANFTHKNTAIRRPKLAADSNSRTSSIIGIRIVESICLSI